MSSRKPRTDAQVLGRLRADAELERIKNLTSAEVCDEIRANGGDPEAIGARGGALAAKLLAERGGDWKVRAAARRDTIAQRVGGWPSLASLARPELLSRLRVARASTRLPAPVVAAFRKRTEDDMSDDELRGLLEEIEVLERLHTKDEP